MNKFIAAALLALSAFATQANAAYVEAHAADGAWGYGESYSYSSAHRKAMFACRSFSSVPWTCRAD